MDVLVVEPYRGSLWLANAVFVDRFGKPNSRGHFVRGEAWESDRGGNTPDDYSGYAVTLTYPRKWIRKVEK